MLRRLQLVAISAAAIAMSCLAAMGDDAGTWFKSLKQPGTGASCCDISDCHPTASEWRGGQWWAIVEEKWRPIPPDKVLKQTSVLEEAVVCNSKSASYYGSGFAAEPTIYCFVPLPMSF